MGDSGDNLLVLKNKLDPILIADPDPKFIESIFMDTQSQRVAPLVAQNGKEAQTLLNQFSKQRLSAIFINPNVMNPAGITLVRLAHRLFPGVPIYFLWDDSPLTDKTLHSAEVLKNLGIQALVPKPISYSDIIKMVTPAAEIFDPNEAIKEVGRINEPINEYVTDEDSKFFSIQADTYLSGAKSFFDVYARLKSGRYLKILRAGDDFSPLRVKMYIKQGATHFYLRKEAQQHFLNYCDKLVGLLIKNPSVKMEVKMSQALGQGEQTLSLIREWGLNSESIQYAQGFIQNLNQLIRDINLKDQELLKSFFDSVMAREHGIGVAALGGLLARALNFEFKEAVGTVGIATLFHDIGMDATLRDKEVADMTEKELMLYKIHPTNSRVILQQIPAIKTVILQAVEQHHERRDRTGFPKGLGMRDIVPLAEIVGIADEFWHILHRHGGDQTFNPALDVEVHNLLGAFSHQVAQAFRNVFMQLPGKKKK